MKSTPNYITWAHTILSSLFLLFMIAKLSSSLLTIRDKNIRYIRLYISDISDIGDVRYDIDDIFDIGDILPIYRF